jgi:hypothetical protein
MRLNPTRVGRQSGVEGYKEVSDQSRLRFRWSAAFQQAGYFSHCGSGNCPNTWRRPWLQLLRKSLK